MVGCPNADILIFASVLSTECGGGSIAYAGNCVSDAVSDRPVAAYVNFCPAYVADTSATNYRTMLKVQSFYYMRIRALVAHPREHRFSRGLTDPFLPKYRAASLFLPRRSRSTS